MISCFPVADAVGPVVGDSAGDDFLAGRARAVFGRSSYLPLRTVACDARDGVLKIWGAVPTYYLKQMAVEIARQVADDAAIEVHIEVHPPGFHRVHSTGARPSSVVPR